MSQHFGVSKVSAAILTIATGLLLATSGVAHGQDDAGSTLYKTEFDGAPAMTGWTLAGLWAVDATPEGFQGGAAKSLPSSLNYNDGVDFDNGMKNSGSAKSPAIDISGTTNPQLKFWCNFQTEHWSNFNFDKRFVKIYASGSEIPILTLQVVGGELKDAAAACSAMGTWHEHTVQLDPKWGSISIEFFFDTVDSAYNNFAGWAVDDLRIVNSQGGSDSSAVSAGASSLVTILSADFDSEASVAGWYFDLAGEGQPQWAVDATPAAIPGGAAFSLPNSLNYNNGVNYDNGKVNSGAAKSPGIVLTGYVNTVLKFQCNCDTENATTFDKRFVRIYSNASPIPVLTVQLATTESVPLAGACASMGTWHEHEIALDSAWGLITVEFFFDTVDAAYNNFAGWAIDDVKVLGAVPVVVPTEIAGSTEVPSGSGGGGSCGCMGLEAVLLLAILAAARRRR